MHFGRDIFSSRLLRRWAPPLRAEARRFPLRGRQVALMDIAVVGIIT